ncbi:MAG: hypothetical protein E6768_20605 [Citrobacter sp.]|nr:hypothetical protein [Citrobacter sp.]MDU1877327.1 hypothetical protein [Citrobacter sp.]
MANTPAIMHSAIFEILNLCVLDSILPEILVSTEALQRFASSETTTAHECETLHTTLKILFIFTIPSNSTNTFPGKIRGHIALWDAHDYPAVRYLFSGVFSAETLSNLYVTNDMAALTNNPFIPQNSQFIDNLSK